jgi:hypothetical protein
MQTAVKRGDPLNGEDVIYTFTAASKRQVTRTPTTPTTTRTPTRTVEQRKPFATLSKHQQNNRLDSVIDVLEKYAEDDASQVGILCFWLIITD